MPSSDAFDQAWQLAKHDADSSIGELFRKKEMTEKERLRLIHELNMINIGRNMRTDGSGGPMMPGGTREWGEAAGVLEPQPPAPAPAEPAPAEPAPENEAENVEANIPMPEEVDETEVHVEEGEAYEPESDHEELPDREVVPDVNDLVVQESTENTRTFPIISPTTERDEILRVFEMAEDGDEDARKHLYNSMGDLEDYFPDLATRYGESFEKHFVLENPFANPFYDSSFNKITEAPRKGIVNPVQVAPAEIIKEEKPKDINGFAMNDNDDLSLLPSSVFASNDAPVADNMSLLPAGWKADVE